MIPVLHAGDGTARLGTVKTGRGRHAGRHRDRAAIGKAATHCGRGEVMEPRLFLLAEPVAGGVSARDRRDQELRIGVAGCSYDLLHSACLGEVRAIEHQDRVADLIGGGEVVGDVED